MPHPGFFESAGPYSLRDIAASVDAEIAAGGDQESMISDVLPLSDASAGQLTFFDNPKYRDQLADTRASACLLRPADAGFVSDRTVALITKTPYHAFAKAMQLFYPDAMRSLATGLQIDAAAMETGQGAAGRGAGGAAHNIHPSAVIAADAVIEAGVIIGKEANIGSGTIIAAGAVIGYRVHIGCGSYIGPNASVMHAIIGDRVVLHAGVRVGQDGFGFAMGPRGHIKVPQIGRVVIKDDVEIGANSCVDRGALGDTLIGEGSKIDDLVMIGHNVVIGRHCVIVAECGIAGSSSLGDFVVMGGHAGVSGHVKIGNGVQIAGASHVKDDIADGMRMGGTPAKPFRQWAREIAALNKLTGGASGRRRKGKD